MRKRKQGRKFNRKTDQRKSLLKSLAREFFLKEKIKTTEAKAKELAIFAEKQITKPKPEICLPEDCWQKIFLRK